MLKPIVHLSKLFLSSARSKTTCEAFISKISPEKENALGNLFGIIEINYRDKDSQRIIETIIKEMENSYYGAFNGGLPPNNTWGNSTQLYLDGIENIETIFEEALQKVNQKLTSLIKEENLNLVPEKLNAIIGVVKNRQLYFTNIGDMNAFLLHKKRNEDYTMVNILDNALSEERLNIIRIFSNITGGRINPDDYLLFCAPTLLDYFSLDKLKTIFTTLTIPSALQQLKNLLNETILNVNLASIIIKLTAEKEKIPAKTSLTSQTSINILLGTEAKTREFLSPSLLLNLKRKTIRWTSIMKMQSKIIFHRIKEKSDEYLEMQKEQRKEKEKQRQFLRERRQKEKSLEQEQKRQQQLEQENQKSQKELEKRGEERKIREIKKEYKKILINYLQGIGSRIHSAINKINNGFYKIVYILRGFFYLTYDALKTSLKKAADPEKIKTFSPSHIIDNERIKTRAKILAERIKRILYYLKLKYKNLPRASQLLLILTVMLTILFLSSIIGLSIKQSREKTTVAYNAQLKEIENKKNTAEASIIYSEEDKGRALLLGAKELINNLPEDSQKQRETKENLLGEINVLLQKLRKMENIAEPILLADFREVDPAIQIFKIINKNNGLYTFNPFNNIIYKLNFGEQNTIDIFKENTTSLGHLDLAIDGDINTILFYHSNGGLAELNIRDNSIKALEIILNNPNADVKNIYLFSNKLYLLDADSEQIYRHNQTLSGYARGSAWIGDETINRENMVSFAVDGAIYVLKNDGEIIKFTGGYKQKFEPTTPDPAWNNPTKIWTSNKTDYIYVLDSGANRLAVFDKKGKLIIQYYSDKFNNLKDFSVNEQEKKIYLLNDTIVYGILASHLK